MINLKFYTPILDSANKVTTELVEETYTDIAKGKNILSLYDVQKRPSYGFCDTIKFLEERLRFDTTFFNPIKMKHRWKITIVGRGISGKSINSKSIKTKFSSMFTVLDTKTVMYIYMNEVGELCVDYCYTIFYPKDGILAKEISTYWDDELVTYCNKHFTDFRDLFERFNCDILMTGSVTGYIRNVKVDTYKCVKLLDGDDLERFNGFPFHFDGHIDMENGNHFYTEVDYRQVVNKREVDNDAFAYLERKKE